MQNAHHGGNRNMTEGSCLGHITAFAVPLFIGSLLQQLYNLVDSWVVGRYVGDSALAAVGVGFLVIFFFTSLFMGISTGTTVVIAQFYGAGKTDRVRDAADTAYASMLILVVPLTIASILLVDPLLALLRVEEAALADARTYLVIVCAGLIGTVGYNTNAGILQGLGNSRTSLLFLAISAILNIIGDLFTVLVLGMGVEGVAYATVFAQFASWIFGIFYINRIYPEIRIRLHLHIDRALLRRIMGIGLPAGLQMASIALGSIAVMSKIDSYGLEFAAGYNVGHKLDHMGFLPVQAIATAATAFIGQNIGAGKLERVREGTVVSLTLAISWSALIAAVMIPLRHTLVGFFSENPVVIEAGAVYLFCVLLFYPVFALMFCINNILRGAGSSVVPMVVALIAQIGVRVPSVYLLANLYGKEYMYYGFGVGWVVANLIVVPYFLCGRWKKIKSVVQLDDAE
ncbi:MAG: MATE family efflux transporter [Oscillospiraceae bacterium]|nr:MATE family efflux transporter [Oscillospiraceae bacterium]